MHVVRCYQIALQGSQSLELPSDRRFLSLRIREMFSTAADACGNLHIWYMVDPDSEPVDVEFRAYKVGQPIEEPDRLAYLDVVHVTQIYTWHLFERTP